MANNTLADAAIAEENVSRLSRIALRMNEDEILQIMHAPYDIETYRVGEDRYDVWFYVTSGTILGQSRMVPRNLTPLTFRNRQLVGVGYDYYHWIQQRDKVRKVAPKPVELENEELEQELQKSLSPGASSGPVKTPPAPASTKPAPVGPSEPTPTQTPPNLKLGPPPSKEPARPKTQVPAKQATLSEAPEKPPQDPNPQPAESPEKSNKPEWDKKDEEINSEAMDQDFDFW